MNCPKCNSPVTPTQKFCGGCGHDLRHVQLLALRRAAIPTYFSALISSISAMDSVLGAGASMRFISSFNKGMAKILASTPEDAPPEVAESLGDLHALAIRSMTLDAETGFDNFAEGFRAYLQGKKDLSRWLYRDHPSK